MGQDIDSIPLNRERTSTTPDGSVRVDVKPNNVIHGECVDIYRAAIKNHILPANQRIGNWAQPFKDDEDIQRFLEAQFKDVERIKRLINGQ